MLRDMFAELGLSAFAKTSGLTGMQVYVPLNQREVTYEQTKPFARAVADLLARAPTPARRLAHGQGGAARARC